jgi:PAS domain S-box-containing protein
MESTSTPRVKSPLLEEWRPFFENSSIGIALAAADAHYLACSPIFREMLGYAEQQLPEKLLTDVIDPSNLAAGGRNFFGALLNREVPSVKIERLYRRANGTSIWLGINVSLVAETPSSPPCFMALVEDITERKQAELALRQRETQLQEELEHQRERLRSSELPREHSTALGPPAVGERPVPEAQLHDEFPEEHDPGKIIVKSRSLKHVLKQVETVSATDATVLLLGETGTGKELIARAIHKFSARRESPFVRADCASIPAGLLENELFGHEKGAFTGAATREIGRLELAHNGTLFLDEVGDIPLELQSKLLRVLQEREFERLGSTRTVPANFRLIAATNRHLAHMVDSGQFRTDLFYRLHVFPIELPPLRDRKEDIPPLVWYFVRNYAKRMKKRIERIRREDMDVLTHYSWPGNVRELQNVIERSVVLSPEGVLHLWPMPERKQPRASASDPEKTLEQVEREYILKVLSDTDWVIGGHYGAAQRLGVRRTTLLYKMRRMGITRPSR